MTKPTPIFCLMGPTASGKTDIAVELVQQLPCEIISIDSAMVYRGMDIGTAKPSAEILNIAPHRLLDICDPCEAYSAGNFRVDVLREIHNILQRDKIPLLVGGTMMYFNVLQNGIAELPKANIEIRKRLLAEMETEGLAKLHQRLEKIDPISAKRIHPNDPQRIQRALEIFELTGKTLTELSQNDLTDIADYHFINIGLIPDDRHLLHEKIAQRFDQMLQNNFIDEVEQLYARGDLHAELPAIRAVGYRQAWDYLAGNCNYAEMRELSIIATRQLAKRQLTWLRSWENLQIVPSEDDSRLEKVLQKFAKCRLG